ncbi:acylneuraminate cytidylyltransferase family protein [Marinicrinis sediminis]|uniref:Cytidylyltransferase domain-containing protein n=1 Tax=Marinicrinis sediminis TaxID=1652465 RepID=A0ABW5R6B0_9BACL
MEGMEGIGLKKQTWLAIIPARGGSKGVPNKNIRKLGGKPLIAWTIEAALRATRLSRIIVTTDSPSIAAAAVRAGVPHPLIRPASLAADDTPMRDVILHTLDQVAQTDSQLPEGFVLLQPTSPFRTAVHIDEAITLFESRTCLSVVGVTQASEHPYLMKRIDKHGALRSLFPTDKSITRRQDFPPYYLVNGSIYACQTEAFLACGEVKDCQPCLPYVMDAFCSLDIDTERDLHQARVQMRQKKNRE